MYAAHYVRFQWSHIDTVKEPYASFSCFQRSGRIINRRLLFLCWISNKMKEMLVIPIKRTCFWLVLPMCYVHWTIGIASKSYAVYPFVNLLFENSRIVRLIGDRLLIQVKYKVKNRQQAPGKNAKNNSTTTKYRTTGHTFINLTTEWTGNVYGMGVAGKEKWNKLANVLSWMSRRDGRDKGIEVSWSNWNHSFFIDYLESAIFVVMCSCDVTYRERVFCITRGYNKCW